MLEKLVLSIQIGVSPGIKIMDVEKNRSLSVSSPRADLGPMDISRTERPTVKQVMQSQAFDSKVKYFFFQIKKKSIFLTK